MVIVNTSVKYGLTREGCLRIREAIASPPRLAVPIGHALGSCAEAQETGGTSTGGYQAMVIHRTHPYPAYGGPGPVTGASTGRRDAIGNPTPLEEEEGRKGVKDADALTHCARSD